MATKIRISHLGSQANGDLAPSCCVLDIMADDRVALRFVVDCGAMAHEEPAKGELVFPDFGFFADGKKIDAVLLTHDHLDHVGGLRELVKRGLLDSEAQIFGTKGTIAEIEQNYRFELLLTAQAAQERADAAQEEREPRPVPGALSEEDAQVTQETLDRFLAIQKPGECEVLGVPTLVWAAGHKYGACSFTFRIGSHHVHFSGDFSDHNQLGVPGRKPLPTEWRSNLIVAAFDCTYGATFETPSWASERDRLVEVVRTALRSGRPVGIFAFAQQRAGVVAQILAEAGITAEFPVYLDGGARQLTQLFMTREHLWLDEEQPFCVPGIRMVGKKRERYNIAETGEPGDPEEDRGHRGKKPRQAKPSPKPYVVVFPPGMGGPCGPAGNFWRQKFLTDPNALVLFSGYVAKGTDGRQILDAAAKRAQERQVPILTFWEENRWAVKEDEKRFKVTMPLRANVGQIRLGGHGDRRAILSCIEENQPKFVVLSHGDSDALASIAAEVQKMGIQVVRSDRTPSVTLTLED